MLYSELSDTELLSLLKEDDTCAYEVIYRRYWRQLYSFLFQQLGSKEEAEEIIHDLMLSLWQNRHCSRIQNLRVYFFIAARNLTNKAIKAQISLRKYREYQLLHEVFESTDTPEFIQTSNLMAAIEKILNELPEKTARIFKMSKMDELPVKIIASKMDLTEKAVEYHITKSLKRLRQRLHIFHSDN
jgi:RNA polymerase sigma factor (sigma-70 family)